MTRAEVKAIACGLLHDGIEVEKLSPTARSEIRAALEALLKKAEAKS